MRRLERRALGNAKTKILVIHAIARILSQIISKRVQARSVFV